jgi:hypothetical protein
MRIIKGFVSMANTFGRLLNTMNQLCLKGGDYRKNLFAADESG